MSYIIHPETLVMLYERSYDLIKTQLDGLSHDDSLRQPPFQANCINWLMGHLVSSRNRMLKLMGEPPLWSDEVAARYIRDSPPVTGEDIGVQRLDALVGLYEASQGQLLDAVRRLTPEAMAVDTNFRSLTLGRALAYLSAHESYHAGQIEMLRAMIDTERQTS